MSASCRLCHSPELEPMYVANGYHLVRCKSCDFAQIVEKPDDDALARLYAELHHKHAAFRDSSAATRENQRRVDFVKKFVPQGATILDAGCASGDFLTEAKESYHVYGVDISQDAIEAAQKRLPELKERLKATKLEELQEVWPQFDAICLWDVIEHLWDPVPVCRDMLKLLKSGGYLFLSTPDMNSCAARIMKNRWAFMIPPLHLCYFSRTSFGLLFSKILPAKILRTAAMGKWTNVTFFFYKLNQIFPKLASTRMVEALSRTALGRLNIYIPTHDILYLAVQKTQEVPSTDKPKD